MTKWMRGVTFVVTVLVAMFAGVAIANVQQSIAAAEEVLCEPVDAADAVVAAPESDERADVAVAATDETEVLPDTEDAVLTPETESDIEEPEAQRELFLPYPIPKIDREQVFNWVEEVLGYLDRDGENDLVETWQSLARRLEEQPNIVWDELVDELGNVGAKWLAEQLDLVKTVREEMRSSIKQLRQETLDVIQEHLQQIEENDGAVDADPETAAE